MKRKIKQKLKFHYKKYYQEMKVRGKHLSTSFKLMPLVGDVIRCIVQIMTDV